MIICGIDIGKHGYLCFLKTLGECEYPSLNPSKAPIRFESIPYEDGELDTDDVVDGTIIIVKDESGAAGTNNITISTEGTETIDGAATLVINTNYGHAKLYSDGTNWFDIT